MNLGNLNYAMPNVIYGLPIADISDLHIGDFDGDLDYDILVANHNDVIILENSTNSDFQIKGNVFIDINQNGVLDSMDTNINLTDISYTPNSGFYFMGNDGEFYINCNDTGSVSYNLIPEPIDNWSVVTDSLSYTIFVDGNF